MSESRNGSTRLVKYLLTTIHPSPVTNEDNSDPVYRINSSFLVNEDRKVCSWELVYTVMTGKSPAALEILIYYVIASFVREAWKVIGFRT